MHTITTEIEGPQPCLDILDCINFPPWTLVPIWQWLQNVVALKMYPSRKQNALAQAIGPRRAQNALAQNTGSRHKLMTEALDAGSRRLLKKKDQNTDSGYGLQALA